MKEMVRVSHVMSKYSHVSGKPWDEVIQDARGSDHYLKFCYDTFRGRTRKEVTIQRGQVISGELALAFAIELKMTYVTIKIKE